MRVHMKDEINENKRFEKKFRKNKNYKILKNI